MKFIFTEKLQLAIQHHMPVFPGIKLLYKVEKLLIDKPVLCDEEKNKS